MEIKFALWRYRKDDFGEWIRQSPVIVSSWKDIEKKRQEGYDLKGLTQDVFLVFKGLGHNEYFLKERKNFKQKFKVPNHINLKRYLEEGAYFAPNENEKRDITSTRIFQIITYLGKLERSYCMQGCIENSLYGLLEAVLVYDINSYSGGIGIDVEPKQTHLSPRVIRIEITLPTVTKHALNKFIKQNWGTLERYIKALPAKNLTKVVEKDFNFLKLHKKYKFVPAVTDVIYNELNRNRELPEEIEVEESAVKSSIRRAKGRIEELFLPVGEKRKKLH